MVPFLQSGIGQHVMGAIKNNHMDCFVMRCQDVCNSQEFVTLYFEQYHCMKQGIHCDGGSNGDDADYIFV